MSRMRQEPRYRIQNGVKEEWAATVEMLKNAEKQMALLEKEFDL